MIYGIEFTTDLRDKQTRIKTFPQSKRGIEKALAWKSEGGKLAWPGSKNNHHRLREVIQCERTIKPPKKAFNDYYKNCRGQSVYPRYIEDFHANLIRERGTPL